LPEENPATAPLDGIARRNYWFALLNGVAVQLGMNVTAPGMVLTVFLRQLGASNTLVGALPSLRFAGWYLPQLLVAGWVESRRRKVPAALAMEGIRGGTYALLAFLTGLWAASHPRWVIGAFLALFTLTRFAAGMGAVIRLDLIGRLVSSRRWTAFFAYRNLGGGVMGFLAGLLVRFVLDEQYGLPFPTNYASLFLLSALAFGLGLACFSQLREPEGKPAGRSMPLGEQFRRAPAFLRENPRFRRYVLLRAFLRLGSIATPFYAIYATEVLGAPTAIVGLYISFATFARILSNPVWRRMGQRRGNVFLMRAGTLFTLMVPLLALVTPLLGRGLGLPATPLVYLFGLLFVCQGFSHSGASVGFHAFLLDIAPPAERPSYIGSVNTILGVVSFVPIIGGTLIDLLGYEVVFALALAFILAALLASQGLKGSGGPRAQLRSGMRGERDWKSRNQAGAGPLWRWRTGTSAGCGWRGWHPRPPSRWG